MNKKRIFTLILVSLFVAFFSIGILIPTISYTIDLDIQAPISKGYNAIASHEMKPLLYDDIIVEKTDVQPFKEGNTTVISYLESDKEKRFEEKIIKLDSLKYLEFSTETDKTFTISKIHFADKKILTRLRIEEEMTASSFIERSFIVLLKSSIVKNRNAVYTRRKQIIESTPDYSIKPEDLK